MARPTSTGVTMDEAAQAKDVILALRRYEELLNEIVDAIGDRTSMSPFEKADLQNKLSSVKEEIKSAAIRNKVRADRGPQTPMERHYFEPAVRGASANFRVKTNSNPITSNWIACLSSVRIDISHFLYQLEKQYPGI